MFNLAPLLNDFPDLPAFLMSETYHVALVGDGSASVQPIAADEATGFGGGIQVTAGSLTLESDRAPGAIVVPTGQCLLGVGDAPEDSHTLFGHLGAGACF
jgi:hypothetical protein